jgi:FixJ family two-component response regulator
MYRTLPSTNFTVPVDGHRYIYYLLFPYSEATVTDNTEELRDIFKDISDEDTVTETQEDSRGSLMRDRASEERLHEIIDRMREDHEFESSLSDDELVTVVQRFYDDAADSAIADELGVSRRDVFRARLDLHLLRDRDTDAPFDLAALRDLLADDRSTGEVADALDVSESTVRRYRLVVEARNEARRVSDRFRSEFEDALLEADMGEEFTDEMADDGLEGATEGTETNVSF